MVKGRVWALRTVYGMEYIAQAIKLHSENPWSVCRVMLRLKYQSVGVLCKCPFGAYLCPKVGNVVRKNYALQQRISSATSLVDKFHPSIWGSQEIWLQLTKFFALQPSYPCHLPNRTLWCLFQSNSSSSPSQKRRRTAASSSTEDSDVNSSSALSVTSEAAAVTTLSSLTLQ